jgi:hypothetical protein
MSPMHPHSRAFKRYHFVVSVKADASCTLNTSDFSRVFMGHMETSQASASDPALSTPNHALDQLPPMRMPLELLEATSGDRPQRQLQHTCSSSRRARMKDLCWGSGDDIPPKPEA